MIRPLLVSALLLAHAPAVPAQKQGDTDIQKEGLEDPFTEKDPDAMAKLGVVAYGPLPWADDKGTADIEKVLGEGRILWLETEHFRIGCNLGTTGAPPDPKARKLLNQDLSRLNKKCRKIPSRASKLSPWVRLHLYAQRAEELYAEFAELTGKQQEGKCLGQDNKFLLLLFQKRSDLARYLDRFCGRQSDMSQRHYHYASKHYSLVMTAESDDGPRDEAAVQAQFRFLLPQLFLDAAGGAPLWLSYGLGHIYERQIPCNMINCPIRPDESVDPATQYDWERKMEKRTEHEALCIPFADLSRLTDFGYYAHVQAWARVDYLRQDSEKFRAFVQAILNNYGKSQQFAALETVYELTPEDFDADWRKWAQKHYK